MSIKMLKKLGGMRNIGMAQKEFKEEMNKLIQSAYNDGYEDGKNGKEKRNIV